MDGWLVKAPFKGVLGQKKRRFFSFHGAQLKYFESEESFRGKEEALGALTIGRYCPFAAVDARTSVCTTSHRYATPAFWYAPSAAIDNTCPQIQRISHTDCDSEPSRHLPVTRLVQTRRRWSGGGKTGSWWRRVPWSSSFRRAPPWRRRRGWTPSRATCGASRASTTCSAQPRRPRPSSAPSPTPPPLRPPMTVPPATAPPPSCPVPPRP
jgi:hypothetical protein